MQGVSTRRGDELVQALGVNGISKSQVWVLCAELDGEVERFRTRPLGAASYPYVWLDATYVKARTNGPVASQAVVIAIGPLGASLLAAAVLPRADPRPATDPAVGARGSDQRSAPAYRAEIHLAPDQRPAYHRHIREFAAAERHRLGHDGAHHRAVHRNAGEHHAAAPRHPILAGSTVSRHADRH